MAQTCIKGTRMIDERLYALPQFERLADKENTVRRISLHAYLIGQPDRIGPFAAALHGIAAEGRGWLTTAGAICDVGRAQQDQEA